MKSVENRLSIFTLVGLLSGFIALSVFVSAEVFSFSSVGGEAESLGCGSVNSDENRLSICPFSVPLSVDGDAARANLVKETIMSVQFQFEQKEVRKSIVKIDRGGDFRGHKYTGLSQMIFHRLAVCRDP
jgi:hypothetical protein